MKLYDLSGRDQLRFSPFCWKTRLALAHKGFEAEVVFLHFADKDQLAFSGQSWLPVLVDGGVIVSDSFEIACYLERNYPERRTLFGSEIGIAGARFINAWVDRDLIPGIARLLMQDILAALAPCDRAYFRASREAAFGETVEQMHALRDERRPGFQASLAPLRAVLNVGAGTSAIGSPATGRFLSGSAPSYADYSVFGAFQFARIVSNYALLDRDDPLVAWCERMLDCFDGLARNAATAHGSRVQ